MAYLFGIATAWFAMAGALFIKDSGRHASLGVYVLWPKVLWRLWA